MRDAQVGDRMDREAQVHEGFHIAWNGSLHRIDLKALTGGDTVLVYGQTEFTRDLYEGRDALAGTVIHDAEDVELHDIETRAPHLTFRRGRETIRLDCDYVVGCDGFHGVSRRTLRKDRFALCSLRSATLSRYYIQVPLTDSTDDWTDDRFFEELRRRLPADVSATMVTGSLIEKSIAPLRSYVVEPMRHGSLFLAGDAAHIVPPTGAKGLNTAASDVYYLHQALVDHYSHDDDRRLDSYSERALTRVWKTQRFSW